VAKRKSSTSARKKSTAKKKSTRKSPVARKRPTAKTKSAKRKTAARAAASRSRRRTTPKKPSVLRTATTTVRGAVAGAVAAVTKRLPWSAADQDAITLLEADHRRFEKMLKQGEESTARAVKGRTELLNVLTAELNLHELVEEKILYPALKAHPEARDIVLEGYQEHHVADLLVQELHTLTADDERWGAKFKVLKESLEHHIQEEEGDMFRKARGIFSREDLQALGAEMAKMKTEAPV
jgi:hemerythrin HHE cation binding domain-containing protein